MVIDASAEPRTSERLFSSHTSVTSMNWPELTKGAIRLPAYQFARSGASAVRKLRIDVL